MNPMVPMMQYFSLSVTLVPLMHGRGQKRLALRSQRDLQRLAVGVAQG